MNEKSMLLLMVVFIMIGLVSYDRYMVVVKGEFSPLAKIVDYAGLSEVIEIKRKDVKEDYVNFHFTLQEKLSTWNEQVREIERKRLEMIRKRKAILDRFKEINLQTAQEAQSYVAVIDNERRKFIKRFSYLRELGDSLIMLETIEDPILQQQEYQKVKRELINLFNTVDNNYQRNTDFLTEVFKRIDVVVYEGRIDAFEGCMSKEHCMALMVKDIETDFMGILEQKSNKPARDLNELIDMATQLDYEGNLLANNAQATEISLLDKDEKTYGELKDLAERLVDISEGDLLDFMKLYETIQRDQGRFLKNLEINKKRFVETQEDSLRRSKEIISNIEEQNDFNFMRLKETYSNLFPEREKLLLLFIMNEKKIYDSLNEKKNKNDDVIYGMAKIVDIDLDFLLDKWELAEKEKGRKLNIQYGNMGLYQAHPELNERIRNYRIKKPKQIESQYQPNRDGSVNNPMREKMREQRERQREVQRQFDRARQRAKEQGF